MNQTAVNLGTTGVEGAWTYPLKHTTPEPITLHNALAQAKSAGVTHVAMEASSHGLDQCRLDGVILSAAGFSNFTQDHLDYHKTFDAYFDAKMGLFTRLLPEDGVAVINIDDPRYVLILTLDEPSIEALGEERRTAGWTAVPVAAEMIRRVAPLLGMRPDVETATPTGVTLTSN